MKNPKTIFSLVAIAALLSFAGCKDKGGSESAKDKAMKLLTSKTWTVKSVVTPPSTATEPADWLNFTVKFSETSMTTAGYPNGSGDVWPSGAYTLSDDGKTITRNDGVAMTIITLNETAFNTTFTVPTGTNVGGRIAELGGDYTFNMK